MLKLIFASQRVDKIASYNEVRDSLDCRWSSFLMESKAILLPVPSNLQTVKELLEKMQPEGILLTGGPNPQRYGGAFSNRDKIDDFFIEYSLVKNIPLIGTCRGMQSLVLKFGGDLKKVNNHIGTTHKLVGAFTQTVNSYHSLVVHTLPDCFRPLAFAEDGSIEAIMHEKAPIFGIMWHPEREHIFAHIDIQFFEKIWRYDSNEIDNFSRW